MFPISPLAERLLASFLTLRLEMKIKDKGASVRHGVVVISLVGESGGRWDSAKEPEGDHGPSLGINCSVGADWSKSGRGWQGTGKNRATGVLCLGLLRYPAVLTRGCCTSSHPFRQKWCGIVGDHSSERRPTPIYASRLHGTNLRANQSA